MTSAYPDSSDGAASKDAIKSALNAFKSGDLRERAREFFNVLGYGSERILNLSGAPKEFVGAYSAPKPGTKTEKYFLESAKSVHIVFQVTDEEIQSSGKMNLLAGKSFDKGRAKSFLFMAVKLQPANYARGKYAEMTREISKRFGMPVCVLFRNDQRITLSFAHRRESNQPGGADRDVLGKVSLIRGVDCADPHRAHLDILAELSLGHCLGWIEQKQQQRNFDGLLAAWLAKLDTEELNKRFYKELFNWFQWAVAAAKFPCPENKPVSMEDHIIRLITRILFVWFVKEKELVAEELFIETRISSLLKKYRSDNDDYYRAVLQNLFFATLNTEISKRRFSKARRDTHRNFNLYRYKDLLAKPEQLLHLMKQTPFINGGLFDCLDSEEATGDSGYRLDCFSDNKTQRQTLSVPNCLFFDDQCGLFPLLNKYKFTVEENTPIEQEVALDPELLGKVFENLLAAYNPETSGSARKQTGSYYTPRAIVDYMVDEALVASLAEKVKPVDDDAGFWRERLHYLLDYADACNDAKELFDEKEADGIVQAISEIKVLDPAAGSGAFPMGVLHKLTLALGKLDPENKRWRELQKKRAMKETETAYSEQKDRNARDALLQEISDTFERYSSDFGRKLYLIQNSIFGVDIQPVACQIAKLRFFISLAIEQRRDDNQENYGIKPLPNLETRFVAADTLIGLQLTQRDALQSTEIRALEEQLQQNRERHFNAGTRRKKLEYSRKDRALRSNLAEILKTHYQRDGVWREAQRINDESARTLTAQLNKYNAQIIAAKQATLMVEENPRQTQMTDNNVAKLEQKIADKQKLGAMISKRDEAVRDDEIWKRAKTIAEKKNERIHAESQKISAWDPYDQNAKADWFDAEWMFGVRDGFDIVIGNPPYVQLQKDGGRLGSLYQDCGFKTFARSGDIYQLFYERGMELLKGTQGILAFITSNSWMRTKYGEKLRGFFSAEHSPLRLIDVGKDAFEAIVDTNILLVRQGSTEQKCQAVDLDSVPDKSFPPVDRYWSEIQHSGDTAWSILSPQSQKVKSKVEQIGMPLKDWDVLINLGIKTGFNEAFIIDQSKRDELVAADPKSAEIIKPVLRGRDIRRYGYEWAGKWIINSHNGDKNNAPINIDDYPAIIKHLEQYYPQLEKRQDKGITPYNLRNCAYLSDFEKEKLIWIELVDRGRFAYDGKEIYCEATTFFMTGNGIKYLCAILNSGLNRWYLSQVAPTSGMGILRWKKIYVEKIPVPVLDEPKQQPFIRLVDKILAAKAQKPNADTGKLEAEIDQLVYQLYNLTDEEIIVIEKNI